MLRLTPKALTDDHRTLLDQLTGVIVAEVGHDARVERAMASWQDEAVAFKPMRAELLAARPRGDRCGYCGRQCKHSTDSQIDHVRPKSVHPELTFTWTNFVPACSACGLIKGVKDPILDETVEDGWLLPKSVRPPKGAPRTAPTYRGQTAWWNPCNDDPLRAMFLDMPDTFYIEVWDHADSVDRARASCSIELLQLNCEDRRDERMCAYHNYRRQLKEAADLLRQPEAKLDLIRKQVRLEAHPMVWAEMKRQRADIPELADAFAAVPAALDW